VLVSIGKEIAWDAVGAGPIAGLLYQGIVIAGVGFTVSFHLMRRYTPSVMMSMPEHKCARRRASVQAGGDGT
jgi:drug/metabolite transporter (DMT)-like permease